MHSKDTSHEEGIKGDFKMGEERIEDIEGIESDTKRVTELGGRDGEIEIIMESTKIGEESRGCRRLRRSERKGS